MSEIDIINKTRSPITEEILIRGLKNLGLKENDIVLVHSSLSAIGWVCGEERTVIEALIKVIGPEGTICMPAHSGGNSDPAEWQNPPVPKEWIDIIYQNTPAFDPEITPTRGIGRVPEVFRTYPGTLRSLHPQTSFCAYGKYAKEITQNHKLTPQFGMDTPLGKLYQLNAKILFLGTDYNTCTCFHMGEALWENSPRKRLGASIMTEKGKEWVWFEDYVYECDDFEAMGKDFEENYNISISNIGNAECRLFDIIPAVDFSLDWLVKNRK